MKLLFNKNSYGQEEIKNLLGFVNKDLKYKNIESDIILETPRLIEFIGEEVYDALITEYEKTQIPDTYENPIKYAQLFIWCMAYLSYSANADLTHSNTGRKQTKADNQSAPWEWQIKADNGALLRRSYKALDRLIASLDTLDLEVWKNSNAYKKSKSLLIQDTDTFDSIFTINNSGQLYYRMVPLLEEAETEFVNPLIPEATLIKIKIPGEELDTTEKRILLYARRASVYKTLARAFGMLPLEMFPGDINYSAGANYKHTVSANKIILFEQRSAASLLALEKLITAQEGGTISYDLPSNEDNTLNFVNL